MPILSEAPPAAAPATTTKTPSAPAPVPAPRRPLRTRDARWAHKLAQELALRGITPNQISVASMVCAALAATFLPIGALVAGGVGTVALLLAAAFIQLRLLCNLVDGLVAVEGRRGTKSGEVWNDLPDRVSDVVILVAAGYAASPGTMGPVMGWACAVLAVTTAYVRLLGGAKGLPQDFGGPMAKPHRMAVMTGACLLGAMVPPAWRQGVVILALAVVAVGSAMTIWLRTVRLVKNLEAR
jgi:phosphatidylglycerophosphate synthase